jgi:plasmid stabilization system protein ParE
MPKVTVSTAAVASLDHLIITHSLPPDTRARVRRCLAILEEFPQVGRQLEGRWAPLRFIGGPWRWMILVYEQRGDEIRVVAIEDGRSARFS